MRIKRVYFDELPEGFKQSPRFDNIYFNKSGEIICKDIIGYYYIQPYLNTWKGSHYGYYRFHVPGKDRNVFLHIELAHTFVPGYKEGLVCDHIDDNSLNNNINNLHWITKSENTKKRWRNMTQQEYDDYKKNCSEKIAQAWKNGSYNNRPNNENYKNRKTRQKKDED